MRVRRSFSGRQLDGVTPYLLAMAASVASGMPLAVAASSYQESCGILAETARLE